METADFFASEFGDSTFVKMGDLLKLIIMGIGVGGDIWGIFLAWEI